MSLNPTGKKQNKQLVKGAPLAPDFFARPTLEVCADLLGKQLCRRFEDGTITSHIITEVEGYFGFEDKASHGRRRTPRSEVMYGPAGHWYVYLCYGVHEMLNVVTEQIEFPAAILIRGVQSLPGPGKLTKALKIDRRFNRLPVQPTTHLWIADSDLRLTKKDYMQTPRIGVDYAGPVWSKKPFRFVIRPEYFRD